MDRQSSNFLETVDHLQKIDQLTGRFLVTLAAELRSLDDVFDLMRLEAGWFDLEIQEVDLKQLLERVMSTISDYMAINYGATERKQDKIVKPQLKSAIPDTLPMVKLDRGRIERILTEALLEAVQISRNREGMVTFLVECNKGWLNIEVSDDGVGLPERLINRIPALSSTSQVVVELHGGNLEIKNQAEGGWVINLKLPIH
jgi:signal transduction histidine kinase